MDVDLDKIEAQLTAWGDRINRLATRTRMQGAATDFATHIYVDELQALHVIARSRYDEYRTADASQRAGLKIELTNAWNDLAAAMKKKRPPPPAGKWLSE